MVEASNPAMIARCCSCQAYLSCYSTYDSTQSNHRNPVAMLDLLNLEPVPEPLLPVGAGELRRQQEPG